MNQITPLLFFSLCAASQADEPKQLLFVGNSLTYFHDMPSMLQEMLNESGEMISVRQQTLPGISLKGHLSNVKTLEVIRSQHWDYVILQESTINTLIPEAQKFLFYPSVIKLDSLTRSQGGKTILYQVYPILTDPKRYCYPSSIVNKVVPETRYCTAEIESSAQELIIIEDAYREMVRKTNCDIAKVGEAFERFKSRYPTRSLFESKENRHPSALGSYLIACVFYKQITGKDAKQIKYAANLDRKDAERVRGIVDSNH